MVDNSFADSIPFGLALPPYSMHSSFHSHVLSRSIGIRRPLSIQLLSPLIPSLSSVPLRALCVKISSLLFAPFVSLVVKSLLSVPYTQPHLPACPVDHSRCDYFSFYPVPHSPASQFHPKRLPPAFFFVLKSILPFLACVLPHPPIPSPSGRVESIFFLSLPALQTKNNDLPHFPRIKK